MRAVEQVPVWPHLSQEVSQAEETLHQSPFDSSDRVDPEVAPYRRVILDAFDKVLLEYEDQATLPVSIDALDTALVTQ